MHVFICSSAIMRIGLTEMKHVIQPCCVILNPTLFFSFSFSFSFWQGIEPCCVILNPTH